MQWLYRYVFRGIGIVLVIGMLTALLVAFLAQRQRSADQPTAPPIGAQR